MGRKCGETKWRQVTGRAEDCTKNQQSRPPFTKSTNNKTKHNQKSNRTATLQEIFTVSHEKLKKVKNIWTKMSGILTTIVCMCKEAGP